MPKRHNKTGRSTGDRFVQLPHWLLDCPAFRSLKPQAVAIYVQLMRIYNGSNNGSLGLSVRTAAARCNIAKDTASKAFKELAEKGFIECMRPGGFSRKTRLAAEWRLTALKCDRTGRTSNTALFLKWGRDKWTDARPRIVPKEGQSCPNARTLGS